MAFRQPDSRGVIAYSSIAQMSLIGLGIFVMNDIGATGATFQMVNHGLLSVLLFLLAGVVEVRTGDGLFRRLGGLARGRAGLSTIVHDRRHRRARRARLGALRLRVPRAAGRVPRLVADRGAGLARDRARRRCTCCAGSRRSCTTRRPSRRSALAGVRDLRWEAAYLVPLVACVLALSVYPYAVTHRVADSMHGIVSTVTREGDAP